MKCSIQRMGFSVRGGLCYLPVHPLQEVRNTHTAYQNLMRALGRKSKFQAAVEIFSNVFNRFYISDAVTRYTEKQPPIKLLLQLVERIINNVPPVIEGMQKDNPIFTVKMGNIPGVYIMVVFSLGD